MKEVNLNEYVKFKLNNTGNKILSMYLVEMSELIGKSLTKNDLVMVDNDGKEYMQLWRFMVIFGKYMHNGAEPVVENNILYFE